MCAARIMEQYARVPNSHLSCSSDRLHGGGKGHGSGSGSYTRLLLTPKLLRRLQRDRQRQTVRWQNFEQRVETVPDSPERGFELALYYAITHDQQRGREAVQWAVAHPCERRQLDLALDWVGNEIPQEDQVRLKQAHCLR